MRTDMTTGLSMNTYRSSFLVGRVAAAWCAALMTLAPLQVRPAAGETAMWGFTPGRNMTNDATHLPQSWNVKTGENILWKAALGSQTYAGPLIVGG